MPTPELRARLFARVAASAAAASLMHTRRHAAAPLLAAAAGVRSADLYAAAPGPAGPGEPRRVRLLEIAPGIRRRVMWRQQGEAAMLYRTEPDAAVPHAHGHDEECLMLEGDLFLDDVLLRPLDYQLAPAGSGHGGVFTDTGVLLYAHGDAELDLRPG